VQHLRTIETVDFASTSISLVSINAFWRSSRLFKSAHLFGLIGEISSTYTLLPRRRYDSQLMAAEDRTGLSRYSDNCRSESLALSLVDSPRSQAARWPSPSNSIAMVNGCLGNSG